MFSSIKRFIVNLIEDLKQPPTPQPKPALKVIPIENYRLIETLNELIEYADGTGLFYKSIFKDSYLETRYISAFNMLANDKEGMNEPYIIISCRDYFYSTEGDSQTLKSIVKLLERGKLTTSQLSDINSIIETLTFLMRI